ncbi:Cell division trigger factor [Acidisarcina polymorpha]|uniref:Trigger factor n=1 Tax=Acidisarcina polymorpha TaxID=2211140 RepID=A0A2Z5G3I8_9BACT|nr:trigger factor [Acidisarcina polymorpha]AXC13247.1 Cell division trigger factor [Acidisarcina polymorpha]
MSSTETLETTPNSEITPAIDGAGSPDPQAAHDHEGHDHAEHDHHHPTPSLNPECTREVSVDISAEEVSKHFRKITKRYQKMARIPGFRAGKVPDSLIRTRFAEQIRQDVVEEILPGYFRSTIDEQHLKPVSQPQVTDIHLAEGEPLKFKAIFEVLPEFSIDGYKDVTVAKPEVELSEAEYDAELKRVLDSRSTMEPVTEERALADGDWAEIDFHGESAAQEDGSEAGADAIPLTDPVEGKGVLVEVAGPNTLPAFNEALRGAKTGQELKFEVAYPEDFGERRLAGKTISYQIEVKGIKKKILPELNDDFAKELGEFDTIDAFTATLREQASAEKKRQLENAAKDALVQALVERFQFAVPESLVQQQVDARLDRGLRALASQGMKPEDMRKLDFERLRVAQRESALAEVKGSILLDKIAEAEHTEVTDEEVEEQLQLISIQSREPLEALRTRLTEDGSLARIREQLRREKTRASLYERIGS